jgi:hypothetical protein
MRLLSIRLYITAAATLLAIAFTIVADLLPAKAQLLFSIEIIILPAIYIIGNLYAEEKIEREYKQAVMRMREEVRELNHKYYKIKEQSLLLKQHGKRNSLRKP